MEPNLFIKYRGVKIENDSDIDLALLGESIIGFNKAIKEIIKISKINGEVNINVVSVRSGSVIFGLDINSIIGPVAFDNHKEYLDFLMIVGHEIYDKINSMHRSINDYVAKNPVDFIVESWMLSEFFIKMMNWAKKQKKTVVVEDEKRNILPREYAIKLYKLTRKKTYKKAISPFINNAVNEIVLSSDVNFEKSLKINNDNFENYLSEDEQVLPQMENGQIYHLTGKIVSLQSSNGEYMKFKAENIDKRYQLLILYPLDNKRTDDYIQFYKKSVKIDAEVVRHSYYQKPKLKLVNMDLFQESML